MKTDLSLLILLPTRHGVSRETAGSVASLLAEGLAVNVMEEWGISDPAIARQCLATRARDWLRDNPKPTHVLWLDDDIAFEPSTVLNHARLTTKYASTCSAVSGRFVNRYNPKTLAGFVKDQGFEWPRSDMPAILAGMGCLMLTIDNFMKHLEASPLNASDGKVLICSGCIRYHDGEPQYYGEDYDYSVRLIEATGLPVVLAPPDVRYGHVIRQVVYPSL